VSEHAETTLRMARGGIEDFDEALRWALNIKDTRFADATLVHFELEQHMFFDEDTTESVYQWSAVVSGMVEET
jgi:hypothetical protein